LRIDGIKLSDKLDTFIQKLRTITHVIEECTPR